MMTTRREWCPRNPVKTARQEEKRGFPGGTVVKSPPANAGNTGSRSGPGGSHMPQSS